MDLATDETFGRHVAEQLGRALAQHVPPAGWDAWELCATSPAALGSTRTIAWLDTGGFRCEPVFSPPPGWVDLWAALPPQPPCSVCRQPTCVCIPMTAAVAGAHCPTCGITMPCGNTTCAAVQAPCSGCNAIPCACAATVRKRAQIAHMLAGIAPATAGFFGGGWAPTATVPETVTISVPKTRAGAERLLEELLALPDGFLAKLYQTLYEGKDVRIESAKREAAAYLRGLDDAQKAP